MDERNLNNIVIEENEYEKQWKIIITVEEDSVETKGTKKEIEIEDQ